MKFRLPQTWKILEEAVERFSERGIINTDSPPVTALSLYNGHFYRAPGFRSRVAEEIRKENCDFVIISAGYGLVYPFQRIHNYEQEMRGHVTRYWLGKGLSRVLTEFVETGGYKSVYGFFSKTADYRRIFSSVYWRRLVDVEEAGYFYLEGIRGTSKVLRTGSLFLLEQLETKFTTKPHVFMDAKVVFEYLKKARPMPRG